VTAVSGRTPFRKPRWSASQNFSQSVFCLLVTSLA
jgi:hypothetical protein